LAILITFVNNLYFNILCKWLQCLCVGENNHQ
jgi:hypothetical protein